MYIAVVNSIIKRAERVGFNPATLQCLCQARPGLTTPYLLYCILLWSELFEVRVRSSFCW